MVQHAQLESALSIEHIAGKGSRWWSQTCWLPRWPLGCWVDRRRKPCKGYTVPACSDGGEGHLPLRGLGFLLPCCLTPVSRRLALQHLQVRSQQESNSAQCVAALLLAGDKLTPAGRCRSLLDLSSVMQLYSQALEGSNVGVMVVSGCTSTRYALVEA